MRQLFSVIGKGLRSPRFYIEADTLRWWQVHLAAFLSVLFMALTMLYQTYPLLASISNDLSQASEYIPNYQISQGELTIDSQDKPLYYSSNTFTLVIDDSIQTTTNNQLPRLKANNFNDRAFLGIYLTREQGLIRIGQQYQTIPRYEYIFANPHRLSLFLNQFKGLQNNILLISLITIFLSLLIAYWLQIIFIAFMASIFNVRMARPLRFGMRIKMAVIVSFVPILIFELLGVLIPGFQWNFLMLAFITLAIMYLSFRDHTHFIKDVMANFTEEDARRIMSHSEEIRKQEEKQKELDKNEEEE